MSRRPLLILAVVTALAAPAAASARTDATVPPAVAAADSTLPPAVAPADPTGGSDRGGNETLIVLAVAGGTLLLGAAAGFEGARLSGRRQISGS
jgi:hypothetical protein